MGGVGAYPGTFDPPTVAHLAVAEAAWRQGALTRVELVVSRRPLGKAPSAPSFDDRLAVLRAVAASRPWLDVTVTDRRLIAEVCEGYSAVIMGLDKWHQVLDPAWYGGSLSDRDRAVASLPTVLLALREGSPPPSSLPPAVRVLSVPADHLPVSSTLARAGRVEWMAEEAARFDTDTGAWSDPDRYLRWCAEREAPCGAAPGPAGGAANPKPSPTSLSPMPGRTNPPEE